MQVCFGTTLNHHNWAAAGCADLSQRNRWLLGHVYRPSSSFARWLKPSLVHRCLRELPPTVESQAKQSVLPSTVVRCLFRCFSLVRASLLKRFHCASCARFFTLFFAHPVGPSTCCSLTIELVGSNSFDLQPNISAVRPSGSLLHVSRSCFSSSYRKYFCTELLCGPQA